MRFGMYLKLWGVNRRTHELLWETFDVGFEVRGRDHQEREVKYENKVAALSDAKRLTDIDRQAMSALLHRQRQLFGTGAASEASLCLEALAIAPFTTGLGNEHPLENGFAFLNPYGLPYLPGSGVKGVIRQAARELASGDWGDRQGWTEDKGYPLIVGGKRVLDSRKQPVMLSQADVLFGRETNGGDSNHVRGVLSFWDVIPQIKGDSLLVEIMTPHQTHYYQHGATPHESGQPTPISFLTVPPGSAFVFYMRCDLPLLGRLAPDLVQDGRWRALLKAAFAHAFDWLGFGAKTAVGYGAMERDRSAEEAARKQAEQEAARRAHEDELRRQREAEEAEAARRLAVFEALPECDKALERLRQDLSSFDGTIQLDKDRYAELAGLLNRFVEQALEWPNAEDRGRAADAVTAACERFGWAPPGLKPDKRKKREGKRRDQLDALRSKA
jgi:CRISPR-associated protein Cmr6